MADEEELPASDRLFRYDLRNAVNALRAILVRPHDRLAAAALLVFMLLSLRAWLVELPWSVAASIVAGGSFILGVTAARSIAARLAFHAYDGVLTADALHPSMHWRYRIAWQAIALLALTAVTLVARPSLLIVGLPSYIGGALIGDLTAGLALRWLRHGKARSLRTIRSWLHRPSTGLSAALLLLLPLSLATGFAEERTLVTVAGSGAALIALALTIVDAGVVRFMMSAGHGPLATIWQHGRGTLLFVSIAAPASLLAIGFVGSLMIVSVSIVLLLLMATRVLAYRLHGKRFAEVLVSMLVAFLIATGFYASFLLPFAILAILGWLGRRASERTWLLA